MRKRDEKEVTQEAIEEEEENKKVLILRTF